MPAPADTVHVLIDRTARWHSDPVDDDTFQALIRKHPRMPLRMAWVHLPRHHLGKSPQAKVIAESWPHHAIGDVEALLVRSIDHALGHVVAMEMYDRGLRDEITGELLTADDYERAHRELGQQPETWMEVEAARLLNLWPYRIEHARLGSRAR